MISNNIMRPGENMKIKYKHTNIRGNKQGKTDRHTHNTYIHTYINIISYYVNVCMYILLICK